ncbi:hypothetical protein ACHAXN_007383 [Cyclotella atomus]
MKSALLCLIATVASLSPRPSHGFHTRSCSSRHARSSTKLHASPKPASTDDGNPSPAAVFLKSTIAAATTFALASTNAVWAVSGGGVDYASMDITGQDFSNNNFKGKDFTQVIAKGTNFAKSNLQGCRFYKAYLVNTNFEGADVRGVSFELTSMDNANLKNINAAGAYFGQSLVDVKSMEGADFTDAQIPEKTLKLVCDREDVKGTNPDTGVETRDSLMCL